MKKLILILLMAFSTMCFASPNMELYTPVTKSLVYTYDQSSSPQVMYVWYRCHRHCWVGPWGRWHCARRCW